MVAENPSRVVPVLLDELEAVGVELFEVVGVAVDEEEEDSVERDVVLRELVSESLLERDESETVGH